MSTFEGFMGDQLLDAKAEIRRLRAALELAIERMHAAEADAVRFQDALEFYADPDTYFACGFAFDPPCGVFSDDFSEDHEAEFTDRALPGKRARAALEPKP